MRFIHPSNPGNRLGMPFDAWPLLDQTAWIAAFSPNNLLGGDHRGRKLREASKTTMATCYARWLAWLRDNEASVLGFAPGDRAVRDRVMAYLRSLHPSLALRTIYGYGARLKSALKLLAPEHDWSWFIPLLGGLERKARAAESSQPKPVIPSNELFAFGIDIMKRAARDDTLDAVSQAEMYRDGLMIVFLAMRPLRLKNMLGLRIGEHFLESGGNYAIALAIKDTKTKVEMGFPLPDKLTSYLQRYLAHHRKILMAGPYGPAAGYLDQADYLWLSRKGRQFPVASFEHMIAQRTETRFGIRLTPHAFRHCAATTIAEYNPEDFHFIRIILGHATIATAERYYIQAKSRQAIRMVQDNLVKMRKPTGKTKDDMIGQQTPLTFGRGGSTGTPTLIRETP